MTKNCKSCGEEKSLSFFRPRNRKDGSIGTLAKCSSCNWKEGAERKKQNVKLKNAPHFDEALNQMVKICSKCKITQSLENFHKNKATKFGLCSNCKTCQKEIDNARYFAKPKEERKAIYDAKNKRNAPRRAELAGIRWRNLTPEQKEERYKKYYRTPKNRAKDRERRARMSPEQKAEYRERNRESLRLIRMRRRARERNCKIIIPFTKADIIKRDGCSCYLCGKILTDNSSTIDHILPIVRGGNHKPENAKIACFFCNQSKGSKTLTEYKKYRGDYERR